MIIALTGKARAGKSAVAGILRDNYGFEVVGFADTLKEMALAIDPIVDVDSADKEWRMSEAVARFGMEGAKDMFPEVRWFLQHLGTEGVRNHLGQDAWVNAWRTKALAAQVASADYTREARHVTVPDCRFPNEARAVKDAGGLIWNITRPCNVDPSGAAGHTSEDALNGHHADAYLQNNSTLGHLRQLVGALMVSHRAHI